MCLALPAKIEQREGDLAWVKMGDARLRISLVMTPEADVDGWVLVHAGFSIQEIDEQSARETWELLEQVMVGEEREVLP